MPRIRSVHPDICIDETLELVSDSAAHAFIRLWTHLDDKGRCIDHPVLIAAAIFPLRRLEPNEMTRLLDELCEAGLLRRYEVDGRRFLCAKPAAWGRYQKPRHPTGSKCPDPPGDGACVSTDSVPDSPEPYGTSFQGDGVGGGVSSATDTPEAHLRLLAVDNYEPPTPGTLADTLAQRAAAHATPKGAQSGEAS